MVNFKTVMMEKELCSILGCWKVKRNVLFCKNLEIMTRQAYITYMTEDLSSLATLDS